MWCMSCGTLLLSSAPVSNVYEHKTSRLNGPTVIAAESIAYVEQRF